MSLDARITGKTGAPPPPAAARPRPALQPRQAPAPAAAVPVAAAAVQPGQTLVLAVPDETFTPEQAARMRELLAEQLPGVQIVVVAGVAQMAVYDPATTEGSGQA